MSHIWQLNGHREQAATGLMLDNLIKSRRGAHYEGKLEFVHVIENHYTWEWHGTPEHFHKFLLQHCLERYNPHQACPPGEPAA